MNDIFSSRLQCCKIHFINWSLTVSLICKSNLVFPYTICKIALNVVFVYRCVILNNTYFNTFEIKLPFLKVGKLDTIL
jgi:hypothetical protein